MEGDKDATVDLSVQKVFLSTPSGWRATLVGVTGSAITNYISIHALRVEGDNHSKYLRKPPRNFYPRPPGGGRPHKCTTPAPEDTFLSTPSGWRATGRAGAGGHHHGHFYPRPPGGGRLIYALEDGYEVAFLSTPSGWRATTIPVVFLDMIAEFLSTPSGWRATTAVV